ncbi:MAG: hypothetical protein EPN33_11150 [Acidobacteria bacterium]|nr:MAG: hypothetical protein EPN33_11150 [Acidobacteriota bacterium]
MGQFSHLIIIQRGAFAVLLGFALASFVCLIFLSGRGEHGHYDGKGIEPLHDYGGWLQEGSGRVPIYLKIWILAIVAWAITFTAIVIHHGYWY